MAKIPTGMNHSFRFAGTRKSKHKGGKQRKQHEAIARRTDLEHPHTVGYANLPTQIRRGHFIQAQSPWRATPIRTPTPWNG